MTEKTTEYKEIMRKLALLEHHIVNLVLPAESIDRLNRRLDYPLAIDDRNIKPAVELLSTVVSSLREFSEQWDIKQTYNEIKYIGNRLKKIEDEIASIKKDGLKQNLSLDLSYNGKRIIQQEDTDGYFSASEELISRLSNNETRECLVHYYGLCEMKPKKKKEIAIIIDKSSTTIGNIITRGLRTLAIPKNADLISRVKEKNFHADLVKEAKYNFK